MPRDSKSLCSPHESWGYVYLYIRNEISYVLCMVFDSTDVDVLYFSAGRFACQENAVSLLLSDASHDGHLTVCELGPRCLILCASPCIYATQRNASNISPPLKGQSNNGWGWEG